MDLRTLLIIVPGACLLSACATVPETEERPLSRVDAALESALEEATQPPPPPVTAAPAPAVMPVEEKHRFDVSSEGTPAELFFMALVDETDENIVVHPDVRGSISVSLNDVTVEEVLDVVSQVYGFSYQLGPAGYLIFPATLQTRIFQIDYLDLQRSGVSRTRVSSGQVSEGRSQGGIASQIAGGAAAVATGGGTNQSQQISGSNINTTYEADFWTDIELTLQAMLASDVGSQVIVNSQTGVIVVRAMPDKMRAIGSYLEMIEDVATRQVVLEAKIVEVQLSDTFRAGINWVAVAQTAEGDTSTFGVLAPPTGFSDTDANLGGDSISVSPGVATTGFETSTLGGAFTMAFDIGDFNAFLELLELQGETRVLSSPRVSTLNNQKAVIKAGTDEFFVTNVSSNTVTGASSTTSRDVELTPFFSGIALDVTPQISADNEVTLHIHPTVSEVTDQQKNLTVSGETDILPLAFSEVRESDSIVKARSGQIIVIGGLMRQSRTDQDFGTPVLGRLPGVGNLFRSKRTSEQMTELVILLKPIVVNDDKDWATLATDSLSRIRGTSGN
ncbi:MAG: pilus (MSHA type) biogenesis protein MshL [Pseudomonadota bacterium]